MLFKNELPPPRYTIDGDFDDNEFRYNTSYSLAKQCPDLPEIDLVLIAPRCRWLVSEFSFTQIGKLTLVAEKSILNEQTIQGFYETEVDEEDFRSKEEWDIPIYRGPRNIALVILPALNEAQAAFTGKTIIDKLTPEKLILATPGSSFMDSPVCFLSNSDTQGQEILVPRAEPPVIVQGPGASAMSRAQKLGIPALALVVTGDGPTNHEFINENGKLELQRAFRKLLKLPGTKPDIEKGIVDLYM